MERLAATAMNACPYLARTSVKSLRQISQQSTLFRVAVNCPVMSNAIAARSLSTTTPARHSGSKYLGATVNPDFLNQLGCNLPSGTSTGKCPIDHSKRKFGRLL
jgi:hypothetical protein